MLEELKISLAKIVQSGFAGSCLGKTVLRTVTVAGKKELTFLTLGRKRLLFH